MRKILHVITDKHGKNYNHQLCVTEIPVVNKRRLNISVEIPLVTNDQSERKL